MSAIQHNTATMVTLTCTEKEASACTAKVHYIRDNEEEVLSMLDEEITHEEDVRCDAVTNAREEMSNIQVMQEKKKAVTKKRKVDNKEPETPENQHKLTEYELYCLEKIKRNEEELKRLGLYKEPQQKKKRYKKGKKGTLLIIEPQRWITV